MRPVSSTNKHHDVTDLVNHGMIKITKTLNLIQNILKLTLNIVFYEIKKKITCASITHFEKLSFCNGGDHTKDRFLWYIFTSTCTTVVVSGFL